MAAGILAAGLALALLPPLVSIWLVFGSGLVALVVARPAAAIYLLSFAVAFGSLAALAVHGIFVGPTDLLVGALILGWGSRLAPRLRGWLPQTNVLDIAARGRTWLHGWWRREPLRVAVFAALLTYLAVVSLSLTVAIDRASTLKEIAKWTEVTVVVAAGVWLLTDLARIRALAWSVLAAGMAAAGVAYWQWAMGAQERVLGTFGQPNPLAGYLNFALPLAIALMLFSPDAAERWVAGAAGVVVAGAEVFARSRGATLGLLAALIIIVVVGYHRERVFAWIVGIGMPLAALAWALHLIPRGIQQQVLDQVRLDDTSLCVQVNNANDSSMERLAHWVAGLRMFLAHPLLGVGAGNFNAAYPRYAISCWEAPLGHAHNYYITAAAETGLMGLLAFLALTGFGLAVAWWAAGMRPLGPRGQGDQGRLARALALGFGAALVALSVHNLFDDLFVHAIELQFALCLAALLRLGVLSRGSG